MTRVEWVDEWGCRRSMSTEAAAEALRLLYDAWPCGLDEIDSSQAQWRRVASVLATFAHEVLVGAIKPEELEQKAREALIRSNFIDLERVVALSTPPTQGEDHDR